jgi:hypothetical protein
LGACGPTTAEKQAKKWADLRLAHLPDDGAALTLDGAEGGEGEGLYVPAPAARRTI